MSRDRTRRGSRRRGARAGWSCTREREGLDHRGGRRASRSRRGIRGAPGSWAHDSGVSCGDATRKRPSRKGATTMLIADSQVHLWGANTPARPWPAGRDHEAQKPYPVTKDMLLFEMELAKVNRIVIVPPSWEGDQNDLALEAARLHPDKFAVMGRLNLGDPASKALVPDWKKQTGMLGMRFTFHNEHNRHFLTDGSADWLWAAAEK